MAVREGAEEDLLRGGRDGGEQRDGVVARLVVRHLCRRRDELRRPDRTEDPRLHLVGVAGGDVAELFVESRGTDRIANPSWPVHLHPRSAGEGDVPVELIRHWSPLGSVVQPGLPEHHRYGVAAFLNSPWAAALQQTKPLHKPNICSLHHAARPARVPKADLDQRDPDYIRDQLPGLWLLASVYFRGDVGGLHRCRHSLAQKAWKFTISGTTLSPVISAVAAASASITQIAMLSNLIAGREGSMPARPASR